MCQEDLIGNLEIADKYEVRITPLMVIVQLILVILLFVIVPNELIIYISLPLLLLGFISRFPHEYLHKYASKIMGVESTINFKRLNACCTPKRLLTWKQVFISSLAPFVVLTTICCIVIILAYFLCNELVFYTFLAYLILSLGTYSGDFMYVYYSLKYRGLEYLFKDFGFALYIYKKPVGFDDPKILKKEGREFK